MNKYTLKYERGLLFVELDGTGTWLLDTGAPASFGTGPLSVAGRDFPLAGETYLGVTIPKLQEHIGKEFRGLIGGDVFYAFDTVFDLVHGEITFHEDPVTESPSGKPLSLLPMHNVMRVPIVKATINGIERRMFFDTGASICFLQTAEWEQFPVTGQVQDFFPLHGPFDTDLRPVLMRLGGHEEVLQCGRLPFTLNLMLDPFSVDGIVGNEVMKNRVTVYSPLRKSIYFDWSNPQVGHDLYVQSIGEGSQRDQGGEG